MSISVAIGKIFLYQVLDIYLLIFLSAIYKLFTWRFEHLVGVWFMIICFLKLLDVRVMIGNVRLLLFHPYFKGFLTGEIGWTFTHLWYSLLHILLDGFNLFLIVLCQIFAIKGDYLCLLSLNLLFFFVFCNYCNKSVLILLN